MDLFTWIALGILLGAGSLVAGISLRQALLEIRTELASKREDREQLKAEQAYQSLFDE